MIKFTPAEMLGKSMKDSERKRTAVLLDVEAKSGAKDTVRFDVDVSFRSVPIPRPFGGGHWYVASIGAAVILEASDATFHSETPPNPIEFKYKIEGSKERKITLKLDPEVDLIAGPAKVKAIGVEVDLSHKVGDTHSYEYTDKESKLNVVSAGNFIEWQYSMVRGSHAISDFLFCNLPLQADCKSKAKTLKGTISLVPTLFRFDQDKRRMSGVKSLAMQFYMSWKQERVLNQAGLTVSFRDDGE